jgi:threonine/homoserine/homoserine lactone efflux protein
MSMAAGITHVLLSVVLGAIVVVAGLRFRATIERHEDLVVGGLLVVTGLVFGALEIVRWRRGHGHGHGHGHGLGHGQGDGRRGVRRVLALVVPFGAAASPDLTVLPVFLAASVFGVSAALGTLVVFGLVTLGTIVGLTVVASLGSRRLRARWIDRYANPVTASLLVALGGLVGLGAI